MIQITTKKEDYITITAPVLVPGEQDCDYMRGETPLTSEQIKEIAHSYMDYRVIDKEHDYFQTQKEVGVPVESYITTKNETVEGLDGQTRTYPKGTWFITVKITDNETIKKLVNGEYTGVSVTALPRETAEKISTKESAHQLIKDLKDPVGYTISLVSTPCVKSARFCKKENNKNLMVNDMTNNEDHGIVQAIKEALGLETEQATKSETIENKEYVTKEDFDKTLKSLKEELTASFKSAVKESKEEKEEEVTSEVAEEDSENIKEEEKEEDDKTSEKETKEEEDKKETPKKCSCKADSKALPIHDGKQATKSASITVYEIMGRDGTGSKIE